MTVSGVPSTPSFGYGYGYYDEENQVCRVDEGESFTVPFTLETPLPVTPAAPSVAQPPRTVIINVNPVEESSVGEEFEAGFAQGATLPITLITGCNPIGQAINEEDAGFDMVEADVPDVPVDGDDTPDQPEIHPDADADTDADADEVSDEYELEDYFDLPDEIEPDVPDVEIADDGDVEEDYVDVPDDGEVPVCVPYTIFDTDFTSGTRTDVEGSGYIGLMEDSSAYTYRYEGDVLPTAAGWTETGSAGTASSSGGELSINTLGTNGQRVYSSNPSFNNTTGYLVEAEIRINAQDDTSSPLNSGFIVRTEDGSRILDFTFFTDRVCEPNNTGSCYMVDNTSFHTWRIASQGNDFMLYDNGAVAINGMGMSLSGSALNSLLIGDLRTNADASATINNVYYYNLDDQLPFASPGTYLGAPVDTGVLGYDHSASTIGWVAGSGSGGNVSVAVRSADDLISLESASWSAEMTGNPVALPAITGQYLQWRMTLEDPAGPPAETPIIEEVSGGRSCP